MQMRVGLLLAMLLALVACSQNPKPTSEVVTASPGVQAMEIAAEGARFNVGPLPFGWKRLIVPTNQAKAAFSHVVNNQAIMINVVYAPNRGADLRALRNHLLFDVTSRTIEKEEFLEIDNREALWTEVSGRLDGARVKMALLVIRIDEWVYDMAYVAVPENFDRNLDDFKKFIHTFHHQRNYSAE